MKTYYIVIDLTCTSYIDKYLHTSFIWHVFNETFLPSKLHCYTVRAEDTHVHTLHSHF